MKMQIQSVETAHMSKKKWVGFCTLQHKQDILDNQYLCSDVIISAVTNTVS